ncbi:Ig-like domain-containing protein [Sulfidibacter corallicola]|uniref:Ig-like domain-containing protein n=1 Tax=Sulfidibacter corallicola TaxID=2818388 RepID=A0A8A4TTE7_SULCO|nr:DUF6531 domain-containing protein [Sulfidibacter corallicola]QTD52368.1 Ig-like domain-containing protein [Sulfidibacter corallicola]
MSRILVLFLCCNLLHARAGSPCDVDGCGDLLLGDMPAQFSAWLDSAADCNGDSHRNILDYVCRINGFAANRAPVFDPVIEPFLAVGDLLQIDLIAIDPDGDPVALSAVDVPNNAVFNAVSGSFSFSPESSDIGLNSMVFRATDGLLNDRLTLNVTVDEADCNLITPTVASPSPAHGSAQVAITRETVVRFSRPLMAEPLSEDALFATFGGVRLAAVRRLSADRRSATLFYDANLPAGARIRVLIDGDLLVDELGCLVDADGDGEPGGTGLVEFDTLGLGTVPGTSVCGRVFASEQVVSEGGGEWVNQPLAGVRITVDGLEESVFAVTDAFGDFRLDDAPGGLFFVHIDGTAALGGPEGAFYPVVGKPWESIPGREISVGDVFLPLIAPDTLQPVSDSDPTTVTIPPAVVAADPSLELVVLTVPPGALIDEDGGSVGVAPVDPSRLPGALPAGLELPLVITVQTDGATNFDEPVPLCLPNLPDPVTSEVLPPGAASALWSFNHDSGAWEIAGGMTVSGDGLSVCSNPGQGVLAPGWHGSRPGTQAGGGQPGKAKPTDTEPASHSNSGNGRTKTPQDNDNARSNGKKKKPRDPCETNMPNQDPTGTTDPVHYFSGELVLHVVDLHIKGRGFDFMWERTYRSKHDIRSPLGIGWDHTYHLFLEADGLLRAVANGEGRRDLYTPVPGTDNAWARNEIFAELIENQDGTYSLTHDDATVWDFLALDGTAAAGRIARITDRNGNTMRFAYDVNGRLITVTDTLDRDIQVTYDPSNRIEAIIDFTGRQVKYSYHEAGSVFGNGEIATVTSPAVTGTPNANDFPDGKTTTYAYTTGFADERLNHNLLNVTDPLGQTYLSHTYAATTDPDDFLFDRVVRQVWGDPDDIIDLSYVDLDPSPQNRQAETLAIINDRNGHVKEHRFDLGNRLISLREYTGRADPQQPTTMTENRPTGKVRIEDPDFFETHFEWNADSQRTRIIYPKGNIVAYVYEADLNPTASLRTRGNLRTVQRIPGGHLPAGDQQIIEERYEYDDDFSCGSCGFNFVTRHTDGRGNLTTHTYDERGNRIRTEHRISGIVEDFEYNEFGQLTAVIHPDNGSGSRRRDVYTYHTDGHERGYLHREIIDSENLALTKTHGYDPLGNLTALTDARGHTATMTYNQLDQMVRQTSREVTDDSGIFYIRDYAFDANDNLVREDVLNLDETGALAANSHISYSYIYDILDNPLRLTNELDQTTDQVTTLTYDGNRNIVLREYGEAANGNQPANSQAFEYDERDLLYRDILAPGFPEQTTTQTDYDANANVIRQMQGIENTPRLTEYVYDGYDRVVEEIDAMGNRTVFGYDANFNAVLQRSFGEITDVVGDTDNLLLEETAYVYDALNRLTTTRRSFFDTATQNPIGDGSSERVKVYSGFSQPISATDDNGNETRYLYDTANRLQTTIDAAGNQEVYTYDANDNLIIQSSVEKTDLGGDDEVFVQILTYDNLDRRIRVEDGSGNISLIGYDSRSNVTLLTDALGNEVRALFDGLDRTVEIRRSLSDDGTGSGNPLGEIVTRKVYDHAHRIVAREDGNGNLCNYTYDGLDRLLTTTLADGTIHSYSYDVHHNIISQTDANGSRIDTQYDLLDRKTRLDVTPGNDVDDATTFETFAWDGLSRLVRAENDQVVVTRAYDSLSHRTAEALDGQTTSAEFDGEGNMLSCTFPGGRSLTYTYDALNRRKTAADGGGTIYTHFWAGPDRLVARDQGNGTRLLKTYDGVQGVANGSGDFGFRKIAGTQHLVTAGGSLIDDRRYVWDRVFNKIKVEDLIAGSTRDMVYDSVYRLLSVTEDAASVGFDYDDVGNRTEVVGGDQPGVYTMDGTQPDPADAQVNQYSQTPFDDRHYDANGSTLQADGPVTRDLSYDYADRMTGYVGSDGMTATYTYDALGRRVARVVDDGGSETTRYYYDGIRVIEERDGQNQVQASYVYGHGLDEPVTMQRNGQDFYYHCDDLYNVVALTDDGGNLVERYRYGDFGTPAVFDAAGLPQQGTSVGNPYLFNGRRWDPESGFYWFRSRYLDSQAGRFLTRDRLGTWGDAQNMGNGATFVGNNPYSRTDPLGLQPNQVQAGTIYDLIEDVKAHERNGYMLFQVLDNMTDEQAGTYTGSSFRYFYTEKYGWVDAEHFLNGLKWGYQRARVQVRNMESTDGWTQFVVEWELWWSRMDVIAAGNAVESLQTLGDYTVNQAPWSVGRIRFDGYHSGMSWEDLASNEAGADFGVYFLTQWGLDPKLSHVLRIWAAGVGAAKQKDDPKSGYKFLPKQDLSDYKVRQKMGLSLWKGIPFFGSLSPDPLDNGAATIARKKALAAGKTKWIKAREHRNGNPKKNGDCK